MLSEPIKDLALTEKERTYDSGSLESLEDSRGCIHQVSSRELKAALDRVALLSLSPVSLALGVLYAVFAVGHIFLLPPHAAVPMLICASLSSLILLGLYAWFKVGLVHTRWATTLSAVVTGIVFLNTEMNFFLVPNPRETTNFVLLILGSSMLLLCSWWLYTMYALVLGGWGMVVWSAPPSADWFHFGFALVTSCILGVVVHTVRLRMMRRLESLHIVDQHQKETLQLALDRAEESRIHAEEASLSKSMFLANMSHEIRTPMNGIIGLTEVVLESKLDAQQSDCLRMVQTSADSLLRILNDILDFSKIEAGRLDLESVEFQLGEVVRSAVATLRVLAAEKGIRLDAELDPRLPDSLVGDPGRLSQILINLIGNAVKFTDTGGVDVRVKVVGEKGENSVPVSVEVIDTGIGIPEEKQRHIFDSFTQADSSTTREYGGSGLGLTISSQLVRLMGGQLQVSSREGVGTTFSFSLSFVQGNTSFRRYSRAESEKTPL